MNSVKHHFRRLFHLILVIIILIPLPWIYTSLAVSSRFYDDIERLPTEKVGLLLGTSQYVAGGSENLFFTTRIEAAKLLYERGKIKHILISGDNGDRSYNEPESMKRALVKAGIPEESITLDYAGFRTLDSIIRARDIFGLERFIIISQTFHTERALYLAMSKGIDAIGFGAADISLFRGGGVYIRELGARWNAIYDVYVHTDATVGGKREFINIEK